MPGRNVQIDAKQDLALGIVRKIDRFEPHIDRRRLQLDGVRRVGDFAVDGQQAEHALDVGQCLPNFAIDDAEKAERHVKLDQEGVDQHEVTYRHAAVDDTGRRAPHHRGDAAGDDHLLA